MRYSRSLLSACLASFLSLGLTGCPGDQDAATGVVATSPLGHLNAGGAVNASDAVGGGIAGNSTAASAVPTPKPPPSPTPAPTPTPVPTALPLVSVAAVATSKAFITLYPPPANMSANLGLPTQYQLSAYAQRTDGTQGGVRFTDRSNGQLGVTPGGMVTVSAAATPGIYYVRVQSLDDANVYQDVTVQVGSTGELDAILQ